MEKDKGVTDFINRLKLVADFDLAQIVDHWDGDLCAIGIKKGNRLVYISTFNGVDNYYYELELLNENECNHFTVLKRGEDVSEKVLISIIKEYLQT